MHIPSARPPQMSLSVYVEVYARKCGKRERERERERDRSLNGADLLNAALSLSLSLPPTHPTTSHSCRIQLTTFLQTFLGHNCRKCARNVFSKICLNLTLDLVFFLTEFALCIPPTNNLVSSFSICIIYPSLSLSLSLFLYIFISCCCLHSSVGISKDCGEPT